MNCLRLWIDSGFPEQHTRCRWWLYAEDARLLEQGVSEPRHWPGVQLAGSAGNGTGDTPQNLQCELLLSADQAVGLVASLPAGRNARTAEVLRYAVEDQLIDDVETFHLVIGKALPEQKHEVIAISRARLTLLLSTLRQAGLNPHRLVIAAQALHASAESWPMLIDQASASLSTPHGWLSIDLLADTPLADALAWLPGTTAFATCTRVQPLLLDGSSFDGTVLQSTLGCTVVAPRALDPLAITRDGINLLQGEFEPAREHRFAWRLLWPLARLGGIAATLAFLMLVGEWAWLAYTVKDLRQAQVKTVKTALPNLPVVVSPVVQLQRALDSARHQQGLNADSDFLPLLAQLTESLAGSGATLDAVRYREARLEVTLNTPEPRALDSIRRQLRARGLAASVQAAGTSGGRVVLVVSRGELS